MGPFPRLFSIKPTLKLKGRKFKGIRGFAGKPFHPPLTDIPITAYVLAAIFDVISFVWFKREPTSGVPADFFISATHALVAGGIVSIFTIITGFWDWLKSTPRRTQVWRTANWHMAVMLTMSILVAADILLRLAYWQTGVTQGADLAIMLLSVVCGLLVSFGAMYGGTLVYEYAFNVEMDFDHAYTESERDKEYPEEVPPEQQ
ncbi:MAG: DUF2231 domain-containing protein, partial [Actinomycetota bacterium]